MTPCAPSSSSHSNKRPHSTENGVAGGPQAKKTKLNLTIGGIWIKCFDYLGNMAQLQTQSRTSRSFNQAVKDYYGALPNFGTEAEIFSRLVLSIGMTQRRENRSYVKGDEVAFLCRFAAAHLKKLHPGQHITIQAHDLCPRTVHVLGDRGYGIFDRYKDRNDRILSEGSSFKAVGFCYEFGSGESCTSSAIDCRDDDLRQAAQQEFEMARLTRRAVNIGQIYHAIVTHNKQDGKLQKLAMIGAFYNGGDLFDFIGKDIKNCTTIAILKLARDIASGVSELHRLKIVHRDLKPANVMVHQPSSGEFEAHIIDFGAASRVNEKNRTILQSYESTTEDYYAPEVCSAYCKRAPSPTSYHSDNWALGCILYELVKRERLPFSDDDIDQHLENVAELEAVSLPLPDPKRDSDAYFFCYGLIVKLLQIEPKERLSARDALKWLNGLVERLKSSPSQV